jgi:hypothetical protein
MFSKSFTILAAFYSHLQKARPSLAFSSSRPRIHLDKAAVRISAPHLAVLAIALLSALAAPNTLRGHGFEGDYFFPPTIQTDDPFATDELSLPTVSTFNNPPGGGSPKTRETDISVEFDKEIFPKFALGISDAYTFLNPKGGPSIAGFDNITLSAKYQLWEVPAHQFIFSVGMEWEVGGSGKPSLTNNYSTLTPTIYFGKGFGDLPDSARFLKPLAVTGTVGEDVPVRSLDPNVLEWGIAIEYSIPYLEQHVKDIGLPHPFREIIPLVEFAMTSQENRGGGLTTGTVNPGVLWEGKYCQIGAEAVIPLTRAAGPNVGFVFNVQIWIDDLFPQIFGFPVFGRSQENTSIPHP